MAVQHVLIVDDSEDVTRPLSRMLQRSGFQVRTADSGRLGIQLYRQHRADVVLLDIIMPEMDGLEVIRCLKKEDPDVRIIAMSGENSPHLATAEYFGACSTLVKPFPMVNLLAAIKSGHRASVRAMTGDERQRSPHLGT